jgi:flagellar hook-associated protein 3 FlgL
MTTTNHISSASIGMASRLSITKLQTQLQDAQKELSTLRHADVGLTLGYRTGETISMRQEVGRLQTITDTNSIANSRLDASDVALKGLQSGAQEFLGNLFLARNGGITAKALGDVAKNQLLSFADAANTTLNGTYVFGGINSDIKPIAAYNTDPASPAKTAVSDAFQAAFGMAQSDANVSSITPAQMEAFLDGPFDSMFSSTDWNTNWSSAASKNIKSRISTSEITDTGTNANELAFRKLAQAYTMLSDLGSGNLSEDTYNTVVSKAITLVNTAITDITRLRTDFGSAKARIANANDRMSIQINVLNLNVGSLEGVDSAEASVKVTSLLSQIQTAYAVTAKIQSLSILNYIPNS